MTPPPDPSQKFTRQKRIVTGLAILLVVAGLLIVATLHRMPLPMRIMVGLGDVFVGCVLLVLVRPQR